MSLIAFVELLDVVVVAIELMIKRLLDIFLSGIGLVVLGAPMLIIAAIVRLTSPGPVLYWSSRVGRNNDIFQMPKFRSMHSGTPTVPTHELKDGKNYLTSIGSFLRRTSIDELPQLWCVLKGEMSIVGPRPALDSQYDLIELRTKKGVHRLRPGITGLAQIRGRDELSVSDKASVDAEYLQKMSFWVDLRIIALTVVKVVQGESIMH